MELASCSSSVDSWCLLYSDTSSCKAAQVVSPSEDTREDMNPSVNRSFALCSRFPVLIRARKKAITEPRSQIDFCPVAETAEWVFRGSQSPNASSMAALRCELALRDVTAEFKSQTAPSPQVVWILGECLRARRVWIQMGQRAPRARAETFMSAARADPTSASAPHSPHQLGNLLAGPLLCTLSTLTLTTRRHLNKHMTCQ